MSPAGLARGAELLNLGRTRRPGPPQLELLEGGRQLTPPRRPPLSAA